MKLEIVTPEAKTYSEDVDMVTLPGVEGEMGIFPQHIPLMTQITAGEIGVRKSGQDFFLAVGEGFVEITGEKVAVMTDGDSILQVGNNAYGKPAVALNVLREMSTAKVGLGFGRAPHRGSFFGESADMDRTNVRSVLFLGPSDI